LSIFPVESAKIFDPFDGDKSRPKASPGFQAWESQEGYRASKLNNFCSMNLLVWRVELVLGLIIY
jgi:hypothetical protein